MTVLAASLWISCPLGRWFEPSPANLLAPAPAFIIVFMASVATEKQIKSDAGYVQIEGFSDAHQGYFCGTCRALAYHAADDDDDIGATGSDGKDGYCTGLQVPVRTYGCCNNWKLASDNKVRGANGVRLKVLR